MMEQDEIRALFQAEIEPHDEAVKRAQQAESVLQAAQQEIQNRRGALRVLEQMHPDIAKEIADGTDTSEGLGETATPEGPGNGVQEEVGERQGRS